MSEENKSFFGQLKNQLATTIGLIITAAGALVVANMEAIFGVNEEEVVIEQPMMEQTIVVPETIKDTVVITKTIVTPPPPPVEKEKEYDW
ncbi:hypothetical protein EBR61_03485 [bacterium]|nr:hypothetical protein [bacterium]